MAIPGALLAAIRAFPDENGPRLVLADWYDQQGDPRATFIRAQIERASIESRLDSLTHDDIARFVTLRQIEAQIIEEHGESWLDEWSLSADEIIWSRGIPADLVLSWPRFFEVGEAVLDLAPITGIQLSGDADEPEKLLHSPSLVGLSKLDISQSRLRDDDLDALIDALSTSPIVEHLTTLNLSGKALKHTRVKRLAKLDAPRLRHLSLAATKLGTTGALALSRASFLGQLESLDLCGNHLGVAGLAPLLRSEGFQQIGDLQLDGNQLGLDGARDMVRAPQSKRLHSLGLAGNYLGAEGIQTILPNMGSIRFLDVSFNELGPDGIASIAESKRLDSLEGLNVAYNSTRREGVRRLLRAPRLSSLRRLDLSENAVSIRGIEELCRDPFLGRLRRLSLNGCYLGDEDLTALLHSPHVGELRKLQLNNNNLTRDGVELILASKRLANLCSVSLESNRFDRATISKLKTRFPLD